MAGAAEISSTAFKQLYALVPFAHSKEFTARENYAQQDALRAPCLRFPALNECREAWCKKYGTVNTGSWDDDGDRVSYDPALHGCNYHEPEWMVI